MSVRNQALRLAESVEYAAGHALLTKKQRDAGEDLAGLATELAGLELGEDAETGATVALVVEELRYLSSFALDYPELVARPGWWHRRVRQAAAAVRAMAPAAEPAVADLVAMDRVPWRLIDTETLVKVRDEAAAAGDDALVERANRALARREG